MGRPPKPKSEKLVPISARVPPPLAEQLAALREETGDTLSAQVEDGLRRHIQARTRERRRRQSD